MSASKEIRRLSAKWETGSGWPQRLNWVEVSGIRGWSGQRFHLNYPLVAIVGENGVGKSTLLQAAASVYRAKAKTKSRFASDFFPDTCWEKINNANIRYSVLQGAQNIDASIRKPGQRWRGNPMRPSRHVAYIDLSRIQPVAARVGYTKLVKTHHEEVSATLFDEYRLERFSEVMARKYDVAKMAITDVHKGRPVPVLSQQNTMYSGFHQGAGETTIAELLEVDPPQYAIVLIDEIESSLHPRVQRRLIRDLAERAREREWQVVMTTHSPYVLSELPPQARAYIMQVGPSREIVYGVSPEFAMTKMDDIPQPECDLYVEDPRSKTMLTEVLIAHAAHLIQRCQLIAYGAASVGKSLGQMVAGKRFPRPSVVFLDGDQATASGCVNLPGDDSPERVVFESLKDSGWSGLDKRVGRQYSVVADACNQATLRTDHHDWIDDAATKLVLPGDSLWQSMCSEWAAKLIPQDTQRVTQPIEDALIGLRTTPMRKQQVVVGIPTTKPTIESQGKEMPSSPIATGQQRLFEPSPDIPKE